MGVIEILEIGQILDSSSLRAVLDERKGGILNPTCPGGRCTGIPQYDEFKEIVLKKTRTCSLKTMCIAVISARQLCEIFSHVGSYSITV